MAAAAARLLALAALFACALSSYIFEDRVEEFRREWLRRRFVDRVEEVAEAVHGDVEAMREGSQAVAQKHQLPAIGDEAWEKLNATIVEEVVKVKQEAEGMEDEDDEETLWGRFLADFGTIFGDFSRSVAVLESEPATERPVEDGGKQPDAEVAGAQAANKTQKASIASYLQNGFSKMFGRIQKIVTRDENEGGGGGLFSKNIFTAFNNALNAHSGGGGGVFQALSNAVSSFNIFRPHQGAAPEAETADKPVHFVQVLNLGQNQPPGTNPQVPATNYILSAEPATTTTTTTTTPPPPPPTTTTPPSIIEIDGELIKPYISTLDDINRPVQLVINMLCDKIPNRHSGAGYRPSSTFTFDRNSNHQHHAAPQSPVIADMTQLPEGGLNVFVNLTSLFSIVANNASEPTLVQSASAVQQQAHQAQQVHQTQPFEPATASPQPNPAVPSGINFFVDFNSLYPQRTTTTTTQRPTTKRKVTRRTTTTTTTTTPAPPRHEFPFSVLNGDQSITPENGLNFFVNLTSLLSSLANKKTAGASTPSPPAFSVTKVTPILADKNTVNIQTIGDDHKTVVIKHKDEKPQSSAHAHLVVQNKPHNQPALAIHSTIHNTGAQNHTSNKIKGGASAQSTPPPAPAPAPHKNQTRTHPITQEVMSMLTALQSSAKEKGHNISVQQHNVSEAITQALLKFIGSQAPNNKDGASNVHLLVIATPDEH